MLLISYGHQNILGMFFLKQQAYQAYCEDLNRKNLEKNFKRTDAVYGNTEVSSVFFVLHLH